MFLASLTGSAIYTDFEAHWHQLNLCARQVAELPNQMWTPVVNELHKINFPIHLKPDALHAYLRNGKFGNMKAILRQLVNMMREPGTTSRGQQLAQQINKVAKEIEKEVTNAPNSQHLIGRIELSAPNGGFERNEVRRLLVSFGKTKQVLPVPLAIFINLDNAQ